MDLYMGDFDLSKMSLILTAVSSLATFCTMFLVGYTVLEMTRQRKTAYRPDIILHSPGFYIDWSEKDGRISALTFSNEETEGNQAASTSISRSVSVDAFN